jgi:hypothetical protein
MDGDVVAPGLGKPLHVGQLAHASHDEIGGLEIVAVLGKLLDRVTAIAREPGSPSMNVMRLVPDAPCW